MGAINWAIPVWEWCAYLGVLFASLIAGIWYLNLDEIERDRIAWLPEKEQVSAWFIIGVSVLGFGLATYRLATGTQSISASILQIATTVTWGAVVGRVLGHVIMRREGKDPYEKASAPSSLEAIPETWPPQKTFIEAVMQHVQATGPLRARIHKAVSSWRNQLPNRADIEAHLNSMPYERRAHALNTAVIQATSLRHTPPEVVAQNLNAVIEKIPKHLVPADEGDTLVEIFMAQNRQLIEEEKPPVPNHLLEPFLWEQLRHIKFAEGIPDQLRTEHMVVIAGTGHGKTQLFQSLILDDIERPGPTVVIDSQSQLIENLLHVVPRERLVHITPTDRDFPLALNLFETDQDSSLYEYLFSGLGTKLTANQATVYRFVSRLVSVIPGGTIHTMREILEKGGLTKYQEYVDRLPEVAQTFFNNEYNRNPEYIDVKQAILRRIYTLLEVDAFAAMFSAPESRISLEQEILGNKIILIDTSKATLRGEGFSIFGRFFIAQLHRAIFSRRHPFRERLSIYVDEAADYFSDETLISEMLIQARKMNVGLTLAFQYIGQMPEGLAQAVMANTSIKLAGGVSAQDARKLAPDMRTDPEELLGVPRGTFVAHYKGVGTRRFPVQFGRLEARERRTEAELAAIRSDMRERYCRQRSEAYTASQGKSRGLPDTEEAT